FFFQAEDGIRDFHVTGVQTCALPISGRYGSGHPSIVPYQAFRGLDGAYFIVAVGNDATWQRLARLLDELEGTALGQEARFATNRSEERRVGKECRSRVAA